MHCAGLISSYEYALLAEDHAAVERLEGYDAIKGRLEKAETALARLTTLRPAEEWHEDFGAVLWYHLPLCEPPYVGAAVGEWNADGTETDTWRLIQSGYLTHWTPLPDPRE